MGAYTERQDTVEVIEPVKVLFPEDTKPIVSATVGGRHTIAVDDTGAAFSFGDDRKIQLGLGETRTGGYDERHAFGTYSISQTGSKASSEIKKQASYRFYDVHMQSSPIRTLPPPSYNRPEFPPPAAAACGEDFTVFVHRDSPDWYSSDQETNVLFCCGQNMEGQCGRNLQNQQQTWGMVRLPKRSRTTALECGTGHCLALLTNGQLFGWGRNTSGQLGMDGKHLLRYGWPREIPIWGKPDVVQGPEGEELVPVPQGKVLSINCGFENSAVICEPPPSA